MAEIQDRRVLSSATMSATMEIASTTMAIVAVKAVAKPVALISNAMALIVLEVVVSLQEVAVDQLFRWLHQVDHANKQQLSNVSLLYLLDV
jgi:hypothetical protein